MINNYMKNDDKKMQQLYEGISDIAHHEPIKGRPGEFSLTPKSTEEILDEIAKMGPGSSRDSLVDILVKREYMKIMRRIRGQRSDSPKALSTAKGIVAKMMKDRGIMMEEVQPDYTPEAAMIQRKVESFLKTYNWAVEERGLVVKGLYDLAHSCLELGKAIAERDRR
jgi:hypothetical protein